LAICCKFSRKNNLPRGISMPLSTRRCPYCTFTEHKTHAIYTVKSGENRLIYRCQSCFKLFSETKNTPLEGLRTKVDEIILVIKSLNDGMSINAATRTFGFSKNTIKSWLKRLGSIKETLLLYALCQKFILQFIEGDELYTKVRKNTPAAESEGWTIVLMDRATRFVWDLQCGKKDQELFISAISVLAQLVENSEELVLFSDGERRYGNMLFELCHEIIRTGKRGRPAKTLKKDVVVGVKNKGSQNHKKGPKRDKYQRPQKEHPETTIVLEDKEIHANHVEAFNASLRRKLACYRRKTNTYAKNTNRLQTRLNVYWIIHNFVSKHFTTKQIPAVAQGVIEKGFSLDELFKVQIV
jgi:transposase-like protein